MFYVYVLTQRKSRDIYIGYSGNLRKRIARHQGGSAAKTTKHGDWHLVYYEAYFSEKDARERERKLKHYGQSRAHLLRRIKNSIAGQK